MWFTDSLLAEEQTEIEDRNKIVTKTSQFWTRDSKEELRGCFEATNWNVFTDNCTDLDERVDNVTINIVVC